MTRIVIDKDVAVSARDGVRLATDVYRLDDSRRRPVLLTRTPYGKDRVLGDEFVDVVRAVLAGFVVVAQDVRGRYGSDGMFDPAVNEAADGVDAIAWAAAQIWSTGVVGMFGGSYLGSTQWLPAALQPAALRALAPAVTFSDMYEGSAYQGGAKVLHDLRWVVEDILPEEAKRRTARQPGTPEPVRLDLSSVLAGLPLADEPLIHQFAPFYPERLKHPTPGPYWRPMSPKTGHDSVTVPALNITGWYDAFLWGTCQNYLSMRDHGGSDPARRHQRLVIGPWTHMNFTGSFPEREFGPAAGSTAVDLTGLHLRWFDHWLNGTDNGVEHDPPVVLFVMGLDQWRSEPSWPLPNTTYRAYHLHSNGSANTLDGDGALSPEPAADEPPDRYRYDPLHPAPTIGGQVILPGANAAGPRDQRAKEAREDVLVYSTPVLDRPIEVTGPVELRLFAASSAPDTDFTGALIDVHPDGRALILTEGVLRARYRDGTAGPAPLVPGTAYELRLDLWATSNVFLPGHRIRLEVSSSNFPRTDRNSNTGGQIATETADRYRSATNQVLHDTDHPSRLILPVIDR